MILLLRPAWRERKLETPPLLSTDAGRGCPRTAFGPGIISVAPSQFSFTARELIELNWNEWFVGHLVGVFLSVYLGDEGT